MAEPRSKRMQVVLMLAERTEQAAAQRLGQYRDQVSAEQEQLQQLVEYTEQYLHSHNERTTGIHADELISFSNFIQRLSAAKKEQELKLARMQQTLDQIQQDWREKYQKRHSIQELITRLQHEESQLLEKRLQKELDDLSAQQFQRRT